MTATRDGVVSTATSGARATRKPGHAVLVRADIQALRAFAVMAVVLFHFWPGAVPGGYIGVDVFFVISGFLISAQLVRRRESGGVKLGEFWAARARRLLPASLLVLAVSIVLTLVWAPATLQSQYLRSIIGSALYVENWVLAVDAVDYLAAENAPPIAQHYWSLSVEEQFYIFWPLLIILATIGTAAAAVRRRRLVWAVAAVTVLGFGASVFLTATNAPFGYFATQSRVWEFGLGALVALVPFTAKRGPGLRMAIWLAGWAAMAATAMIYGPATPFPGVAALLPVLGAAAVIASGPDIPVKWIGALVAWRPVQWLGDQSYGIYLWHWPLIVIAPFMLGHVASFPERVALLVITIAAAALAKRFIEDPIRFSARTRNVRPRVIGLVTAAAMALVVAAAAAPIALAAQKGEARQDQVEGQLTDPAACRGAAVLLEEGCAAAREATVDAADVVPTLANLYEDTGGAFACYDQELTGDPSVCRIGSEDPDAVRIALTGDSHAAMLIPGLREEAESRGWAIDTIVGRGCVWQAVESPESECADRWAAVEEILLSGDYDAVVVTAWNREDFDAAAQDEVAARMTRAWETAKAQGITVIGVADNPPVPQASADCLAASASFTLETCAFDADEAHAANDPIRQAGEATGSPVADLWDAYCADDVCPMVMGGVVVYRDLHHITGTFSKSLAPYLADEISAALPDD
ncbi:acyltransferase family protein [Microbacterium sp. NPDC019599]|uniref:acyltransferase family protein n=1 Tax=Microbacterium sp. NPDC019599 TaxID=3154690 RepID=UPI0033CEF169